MKTLAALIIALSSLAFAQEAPQTDEARYREAVERLAAGLNYQQGEINLKNGLAKIVVPAEFRYLGPADATTVLTKIWGNPPSDTPLLGMLLPANASPTAPSTWAVVIQYEEDGYVKDDDASKIDYNDMLKSMQASSKEANEERAKQGYPTVELIGWAAPPRYDSAAKKLYWAKELKFGVESEHTLNYNIRMLGRRGVLVLNAVAAMPQLAEIEQATPAILSMVDFQEGHRYADFNASTDKVATYGLAALVAGGVLAKTGLFKVLIGALIAGKKFVIIGLIALGVLLKKFLGKREPIT